MIIKRFNNYKRLILLVHNKYKEKSYTSMDRVVSVPHPVMFCRKTVIVKDNKLKRITEGKMKKHGEFFFYKNYFWKSFQNYFYCFPDIILPYIYLINLSQKNFFSLFFRSKSDRKVWMFMLRNIIIFQNGWKNKYSICSPMRAMRGKYGGHAVCNMSTKFMQILRRTPFR